MAAATTNLGGRMTTLATDTGRTDIPLLDDTIGANLA